MYVAVFIALASWGSFEPSARRHVAYLYMNMNITIYITVIVHLKELKHCEVVRYMWYRL